MFLLGHSCWSYLFSKLTGRQLHVNLPAYMAFLAGTLPDFDIYFGPWILHHTYTHSLIVLMPICVALVIRFKGFGLAFSAGILSHLVTDFLVGSIPPLYPLSDFQLGINLGLPSPSDTFLETGALGLVLILACLNGDYKLVTKPQKSSLYLSIPMIAIVTLSFLFLGDKSISLTSFAFSRKALTLITLGHGVLIGLLALGFLQGCRHRFTQRARPSKGPDGLQGSPPILIDLHEVTPRINSASVAY